MSLLDAKQAAIGVSLQGDSKPLERTMAQTRRMLQREARAHERVATQTARHQARASAMAARAQEQASRRAAVVDAQMAAKRRAAFDGMTRAAVRGVKTVAAAATIAAVAFAKIGADELIAAREASASTAAVLEATGGAANVTQKHVERLAEAKLKLSGVDDQLIQQGLNVILTFKNVRNEVGAGNQIFDRAAQSALDMSTTAGGAFGDMNSASKMLGKALNDPVKGMTALSRAGITFSKEQKERVKRLVETNRTLDAQKLILREVESQVGGQAKAFGELLPQRIARAKEEFAGIAATVVELLIPAFEDGLHWTERQIDAFGKWSRTPKGQEQVMALADALRGAATVARDVVVGVGNLAGVLIEHREATKTAAFAVGSLVIAWKGLRAAQQASMWITGASVAAEAAATTMGGSRGMAGAAAGATTSVGRLGRIMKLVPFGPWGLAAAGAATAFGILKARGDDYPSTSREVERALDRESIKLQQIKEDIDKIPRRRKVVVEVERKDGGPGRGPKPKAPLIGPPAPDVPEIPTVNASGAADAAIAKREDLQRKLAASLQREEEIRGRISAQESRAADLAQRRVDLFKSLREAGLSDFEISQTNQVQTLGEQIQAAQGRVKDFKSELKAAGENTAGLRDLVVEAGVVAGKGIRRAYGPGGDLSRPLQKMFDSLPGMASRTAAEVRRELMKMAGGPVSRPVAKRMLQDMTETARVAKFGTSDVERILELAGLTSGRKFSEGVSKNLRGLKGRVSAPAGAAGAAGGTALMSEMERKVRVEELTDRIASGFAGLGDKIKGAVGTVKLSIDAALNLFGSGGGWPLGDSPAGAVDAFNDDAAKFGLAMTSGFRKDDDGYHGVNRARDYSNGSAPTPQMMAFAKYMAVRYGSNLAELIYSPLGYSIKNGKRVGAYAVKDHYDHVHVALQRGGLVPGQGEGDKVPALLEPGEGIINKRAVAAMGGPAAIQAINAVVPRFQSGGGIDALGRIYGTITPDQALGFAGQQAANTPELRANRATLNRQRLARLNTLRNNIRQAKSRLRPLANQIKGKQRQIRQLQKDLKKAKKAQKAGIQRRIARLREDIAPVKRKMKPFLDRIAAWNAEITKMGFSPESIDQDLLALAGDIVSDESAGDAVSAVDDEFAPEEAAIDLELATAEGTADTADDAAARDRRGAMLRRKLDRLRGISSPASLQAQAGIIRELNDLQRTATEPSEDVRAMLEQERERNRVAAEHVRLSDVAMHAMIGAGDLTAAGRNMGANVTINTLHPGDPRTLDFVQRAATQGMTLGNPGMRIPSTYKAVG